MEPYARALMRFAHAAVVGRGRVEAFALGTRLTRLTRELSSRDPDAALRQAGQAVARLVGRHPAGRGTAGVQRPLGLPGHGPGRGRRHPVRRLGPGRPRRARRADGAAARVAHRVVWVNPLKATPGYAPLARGMAAALPYVDEFVEGHSLASLRGAGGGDRRRGERRVLDDLDRWRAAGKRVAHRPGGRRRGLRPRPPGAAMAVTEDGEVAGSVSGGCVEGAVVTEALDILETGDRRLVTFGYSDDEAFAVGLTCGGTIHLFIEPLDW